MKNEEDSCCLFDKHFALTKLHSCLSIKMSANQLICISDIL